MWTPTHVFERLHERYGFERRVRVLAGRLAELVPPGASVLDVGCGSGDVAATMLATRPDIHVEGLDVLVRPSTRIPVRAFDGVRLPHAHASVDVVMFVDVLHHADDPVALLAEGARVARHAIVLKDHLADGLLAVPTLRFMDEVGNRRHGVRLPFNYLDRAAWHRAFERIGLGVDRWTERVPVHPFPANLVFRDSLHVIARLTPSTRRGSEA